MRKYILKIAVILSFIFVVARIHTNQEALSTIVNDTDLSGDSRIVFVKNIYGKYEGLYVMDSLGNNVRRIPNICWSRPVSPVWSPSGEWIAFGCDNGKGEPNLCISNVEGKTPDAKSLDELGECYSYPGAIDRNKIPAEVCAGAIHSVAWSPDGDRLALSCSGMICLMDLDGAMECLALSDLLGEEVYMNGIVPVDWSPTNDMLALGLRQSIYLLHSDGSDVRFFVDGWNPSWSSDGSRLAFFQSGVLCVEDFNEENRVCYDFENDDSLSASDWDAPPRFLDGKITWSSDDKSIAFSAGQLRSGGLTAIYVLHLDKGTVHQITLSFDGQFSYPDWSP